MENKTIEQLNKLLCTGCGLCSSKCPKGCISMPENKEGFRFPEIDKSVCINCGICLNMCPATAASDTLYRKSPRSYFAAISDDKETLIKSSSGGVFAVLAKHILTLGGYVCGCVYDRNMEPTHIITNKDEDIEKMFGSKYVQSRTEHCFPEILKLLNSAKTVMFTGTACQISSLLLFLGKDFTNLLCVEILCHGVPSPGFFRVYKNHLEKKLRGKVTDIRFRDKLRDGWGSEHRTCIIYEKNGKVCEHRPILPAYFSAFFYGLNLRESCYNCKFATSERVADLTIGDFWGSWAKYGKRFDEGISVVGINSEKGQSLCLEISKAFDFYDFLTEAEAIKSNDNFTHPIPRPHERSSFYNGIFKKGYRGMWKKAYLTRTYRKKTLASVYGALIPAKMRFFIQTKKSALMRVFAKH